jgi:hypothetical protein
VSSISRSSVRAAAAVLAAGLALSACSTLKMGAAAVTANSRISTSTLTAQVAELNVAYAADKAEKHLSPQRPVGQEPQQVLTWLILFKVFDEMAARNGIRTVTATDEQKALRPFEQQAQSSHLTLDEYFSVAFALPPDLKQQFSRAVAINNKLASNLNGGTLPSTPAAQAAVSAQIGHQQCLAAKSLDIAVNPQYGQYDYARYQVLLVPPALAANPVPSPTPSLRLTPAC